MRYSLFPSYLVDRIFKERRNVFLKPPTVYKDLRKGSKILFYASGEIREIIGEGTAEKVGLLIIFIPPRHTVIKSVDCRTSISYNFQSGKSGIYISDDRFYFVLMWPCSDLPYLEFNAISEIRDEGCFRRYSRRYERGRS